MFQKSKNLISIVFRSRTIIDNYTVGILSKRYQETDLVSDALKI